MYIMKYFRGALAVCLLGAGFAAHAQFPDKPITLVNPFPNGGVTDRIARIFAPKVSQILGQPVLVEGRPGAGTVIGNAYVARARPDGYTLLVSQIGLASTASLMKNLPYDARKAFTPIAGMGEVPGLILASKNVPFHDFRQFADYARQHPGKVTYATTGMGAWPHLGMASLAVEAHLPLTQIPYKGTSEVLPDLIAGRVDTMLSSYSSSEGLIKSDQLKILASTSKRRVADLPDVPTVAELGYPEYESSLWVGVAGPAGMPPEIVAKLESAFLQAANSPDVRHEMEVTHIQLLPLNARQFGDLQNSEIDKWARVIKELGLSPQ